MAKNKVQFQKAYRFIDLLKSMALKLNAIIAYSTCVGRWVIDVLIVTTASAENLNLECFINAISVIFKRH